MKIRTLFVAIIVFCLAGINVSADPIHVPDDYSTIQEAVDNAVGGDTIIVGDGTYYENVDVDKQLTLKSENGSDNCIVDAGGSGSAIKLSADGVTVEGFTATNSGVSWSDSGIEVVSSANNITNNNVSNNYYGIFLDSSNNIVADNTVSFNTNNGIYLYGFSNNNSITNNNALNNENGIVLGYSSNNNSITNNNAKNNFLSGIVLYSSNNNNTIKNNNISNNDRGIYFFESCNNSITNNNISNNEVGIFIGYSTKNTITNNNISNNEAGICFHQGTWVTAGNNKVYLNNFINNYVNVNPWSTNMWNSTEKITYTYNGSTFTNYLGNYWDDYTGSDSSPEDGIGDTPYSIDGDNDSYPLMQPFEAFSFVNDSLVEIGDYTVNESSTVRVPLWVNNTVDLGGIGVNLSFDPSVVHITAVSQGDMDDPASSANINNSNGWALIAATDASGESGNVIAFYVNFTAVGGGGDYTDLNIKVRDLIGVEYNNLPYTVDNGSITIFSAENKGNFDGDCDIDFYDFMDFAATYNTNCTNPNYNSIGDFDNDCDVDFIDFMEFAAVYNTEVC